MAEFKLDVVTPEKSIARDLLVDSVVFPGELGQMNALPNHVNIMTALAMGSFAYRTGGEWRWAFLSGGFAQIKDNKITVLAETMDLAKEIDIATAELELQGILEKIKKSSLTSPEYSVLMEQKSQAENRIQFAKKHSA